MAKYKLQRIIEGLGKAGDIVELSEEEFSKAPHNSRLELLNPKVEVHEKEIIMSEEEKSKKEFIKELNEKAGISLKRAEKIVKKFGNKIALLDNIDKLPFEKIENEALIAYYGKKIPKKTKGGKK